MMTRATVITDDCKLPPDESECSDSQGEFENKRRKSFRSEQDRLSLHADEDGDEPDNDIDNLLNEQSVKVNDQTTTDEDTLLRDLAKTFDVEEATGNDIKQQLADIANKRWGKKHQAEKLKPILDKYKQPANCSAISAVKVNSEIWSQLQPHQRKGDLILANMQQTLRKIAFANLQTAEALLLADTAAKADESKTKPLQVNCVDSVALLGHINLGISSLRRAKIKPVLKEEYATICANDGESNSFLFLPKKLRDAKETSKLSQVSTNSSKSKTGPQNPRYYRHDWHRGGDHSSKPYFKKDFHWRGQSKCKKKFPKPVEKTGNHSATN